MDEIDWFVFILVFVVFACITLLEVLARTHWFRNGRLACAILDLHGQPKKTSPVPGSHCLRQGTCPRCGTSVVKSPGCDWISQW